MKKNKVLILMTLLIVTNLFLLSTPAIANVNSKPIVVCTNTLLGAFASEVGGDNVTVISILPPGICPSHYDISPADVYAVSNATLLLDSGLEPWINDLVSASGNDNITHVSIEGTWHPYTNGITYLNSVKAAMIEAFPTYTSYFITNYEDAKNAINLTAQTLKEEADTLNVSQINVICMQWQNAFVAWLGFNVTVTYPPPETLSTAQILELTAIAEGTDIALVIDNLPSGTFKILTSIPGYEDYNITLTVLDGEVKTHDFYCKTKEIEEPPWG